MDLFSHVRVKRQDVDKFFSRVPRNIFRNPLIEREFRKCDTVRTMILVRNAKIIDGTGAPERHGDVLISGKSISAIGNFPHKKTETVIDALGHRLVPGFVNIRAETAHATDMLTDPAQEGARAEGFTTLVGGGDGASLAPLVDGSLAQFGKWPGAAGMNVGWRTTDEFRKAFCRVPRGVNFATFAGYNTVRRAVLHENGGDPAEKEQDAILHVLEEALREGALGIAVNLDTAHGRRISHEEVRRAASLCAKLGKPLMLRPRAWTEHFMEAASEALALYRTTGVRMVVADVLPRAFNKAEEKDFRPAYAMLADAGDGLHMEARYGTERAVALYGLLPRFAQTGTIAAMRALVGDKGQRKSILAGLPRLEGARIVRVPREHAALAGATLESFARNRGLTAKEAVLELMRITGLRATVMVPQEPTGLHAELMGNPRVLASGSPQSVFEAADAARLPLETAVMKLTGLPASVLGFAKRGVLGENYAADLALMDDRNNIVRTVVNGDVRGLGGTYVWQ